ncbi:MULTISPECIES: ammonium transporter [unclassified Minwuia]|uniref:ammonium transporter n=1 Tax=unclassified Minwuia TaxID=2618799 RepID=UPI0024799EF4|nr:MULTISPECIES: ammonium transporter [unclassified Minwuia]
MNSGKRALLAGLGAAVPLGLLASPALAEVSDESAYIFNTLSFLMCGFLVMFMAAGFAMLESGMVRSKNVATICVKNIALYSIAGLMFWLIGYDLMYGIDEGGFIGSFSLFWAADDSAALAEAADFSGGYSASSDWFFQMVFVATAASIVSGTVAERVKLWPFLIFVAVLTAVIYPIQGSWEWGAGWLDAQYGFSDFAGSTLVHSTGGWAALMGALIIGARKGKYTADGKVNPMPGSSMPLATLGVFILWLGWFGFNGGSQLALGSAADAIAISNIFVNTNVAAAAGVVAAMIASQLLFKKVDLTMALNGAIGGLVSITAEPLAPSIGAAVLIGAVGGVLVVVAVPLLDKLKIDDVVGAIPAHLVCGIWGTLAVPITNSDASFGGQIVGIIAIGLFVSITSAIVWMILKVTVGVRASEEDEELGLDRAELGMEAYPEFGRGSQFG